MRTLVLLGEALLAHDVYVCLERPIGALPPEVVSPPVILHGFVSPKAGDS